MSKKIDNGGPAFARSSFSSGMTWNPSQEGMTLRDYFAAKAMEGDWAAQSVESGLFTPTTDEKVFDRSAMMYYRMADAMLRAREVMP